MTKELLFESIGYVDDDLLERCESAGKVTRPRWGRWLAAAACLCLALAGAFGLPRLIRTETTLEHTPAPTAAQTHPAPSAEDRMAVYFNPISELPESETAFFMLTGRALTGEETAALIPERLLYPDPAWMEGRTWMEGMEVTGSAQYYGYGPLYELLLEYHFETGVKVEVSLRDADTPAYSFVTLEPTVTAEAGVKGITTTSYIYEDETGGAMLWSTFERDGVAYWFTANAEAEDISKAAAEIHDLVAAYANSGITVDLSAYAQ